MENNYNYNFGKQLRDLDIKEYCEVVDNTFDLIFNDDELSDLIDDGKTIFLYNPFETLTIRILEIMLKHYERQEEYERCHILKNYMSAVGYNNYEKKTK